MFGIGGTELLVILVVALLVLGPKNLAKFSRGLGRVVGEFRRVSTDFQRTLNAEAANEEYKVSKPTIRKKDDAGPTNIPPDSPVAQAVARAKAEADARSGDSRDG